MNLRRNRVVSAPGVRGRAGDHVHALDARFTTIAICDATVTGEFDAGHRGRWADEITCRRCRHLLRHMPEPPGPKPRRPRVPAQRRRQVTVPLHPAQLALFAPAGVS